MKEDKASALNETTTLLEMVVTEQKEHEHEPTSIPQGFGRSPDRLDPSAQSLRGN
jgi:hypothetical protein